MARGKKKGATSFVSVSLETLNTILRPEANVLVSRRFAETLGIEGDRVVGDGKVMDTYGSQIEIAEDSLEINVSNDDF
tara:strand:+ start:704 stop:937 length:234 start_codon:yes stop_codon:yes gene_type:complete